MVLRVCATFSTLAFAAAHGSLVHPRPRNSIDYLVNVWPPAPPRGRAVHRSADHPMSASIACTLRCPYCVDAITSR